MLNVTRQFLSVVFLVAAVGVSQAAAETVLDLLEFEVEGNTVLTTLDIERALYPHLGQGKRMADLERARAALETAYQDAGYLSVTVIVPEQKVADGLIRLQVLEGNVEKLKVSGNRYYSREEIRAQAPSLAPGEVPHFPSVQKELADLSASSDRRVTPLLRPGRQPGKLEVELAVEDGLPLHGQVELNNKQSPDTSTYRIEAGLRYENLFQKRHSIGLNYVVSPEQPDEVSVLSASYTLPLSPTRSLAFSLMNSNSNIASAADSTVVGKGNIYGLRFIQQLPAPVGSTAMFHSLALGVDYKDLGETQNVLGADQKVAPLRYFPFMAQYTLGSYGNEGEVLGNLYAVAGLRGDARIIDCQGISLDQFECRRAGARENFAILRGDFTYTRRLGGWEGQLRLDAQAASQPLVSNEQFLAGGTDSVRGYYEGEAAGDFGWRYRAEIRTPSIVDAENTTLRAVGFVEGATLRLHDPLPGQTSEFHLASAGFGLRLTARKSFNLNVDLATALRAGPRTERGDRRAHVRLGYQF